MPDKLDNIDPPSSCGGGCCSSAEKDAVDDCHEEEAAASHSAAGQNERVELPTPEDDCCSPPKPTEEPAIVPAGADSCKDTCCSSAKPMVPEPSVKPILTETPAAPNANADSCNDGCCSSGNQEVSTPSVRSISIEETKPSNCCSGEGTEKKDSGCGAKKVEKSCDECDLPMDNKGGCCDVSCLNKVALQECKKDCGGKTKAGKNCDDNASTYASSCNSSDASSACENHKESARQRFGDQLERLGCICRALLALNMETCCSSRTERRKLNLNNSRLKRTKSPKQKTSRTQIKTCGSDDDCCKPKVDSCSTKGCCTSPKEDISRKKAESVRSCSKDACCSSGTKTLPTQNIIDLEKGPGMIEHIILSIQGMTCAGCETKLSRALSSIASISNIRTSLVLCRAEFDIDTNLVSVDEVIAQLKRATEFSCERITNKGQELEVLATADTVSFLNRTTLPDGVTDMTLVEKKYIRISYDPKVIGARDILEKVFGEHLQLAPLRPDPSLAAGKHHVRRVGLMTLFSALLTIPVLVLAWAPIPQHELVYGSISLALASIVQIVVAGPFYPAALKGLFLTRVIEMDLLIVLSTSAAYIFSLVAFGYMVRGHPLSTGEFFETSTLLVTLIMLGRYLSALARQKAAESISVRSLQTKSALLVTQEGKEEREIDARLLQYGDIFRVVPDSRIATDGTVLSGASEVDESMMTGESKLLEKKKGSPVIAGSVNGIGSLNVRVSRLPGENTISTIAAMVDEAKLSKSKTQEIADRVASFFVPVIVLLSIITFVIWIAVCIAVRKQSGSEATVTAITYSIAVLIVSCPCAIGLAVPIVIVIAGGVGADHGVIFKTAEAIEIARKTTHVIFDKTGTLTEGKLAVSAEEYPQGAKESTMGLLLGLISNIKHPVSAAVANHLKAKGASNTQVNDVKALPGKGVEGTINGSRVRAGNSRWLNCEQAPQVQTLLSKGYTVFCVMVGDDLCAIYGLEDSIRSDAITVVTALSSRNISISIVSGDDDGAVQSVATKLGVPLDNVRSRCSPSDKQKYIKDLNKTGQEVIIFCGDGTNDAIALAQASIGVHVNEGTDVAKSAADVVLIRPSLMGILVLMDLSKAVYVRIVMNFSWAFIYNVFAILLAGGAFVKTRIPPEYAGLGEIVSVLPVIAIGLQLKMAKFNQH